MKKWLPIFSMSAIKLLVLPILTIGLLSFFDVTGMSKSLAVLYAGIPCAGNAYILAQQMGGDAETMAAIISTSTLLYMVTIPVIFSIAQFF